MSTPNNSKKPVHPGTFIKEHVIPRGMSVTVAAKKLGVGRPALSNLLNGKSSLSPDMAVRLEKSFGVNSQELLDLQTAFDREKRYGKDKAVSARAYVPDFLAIEAKQIHDWAEKIKARHLLPVLLRKLAHSTGRELRQVDFPGGDNAERKGPDGLIEADAATPWIPEGKSYWELGTSQDPRKKAEDDYVRRLKSISPAERAESTFVFATPRNWSGKTKWVRDKHAAGDWKSVRAFDASDLEQWLGQSIHAQMWFAEQLGMPVNGFKTLERFWEDWAVASEPKMSPMIFEPSVIAHRETFKIWLERPSEKPFVVAADSKHEALAFLSCLFQDDTIEFKWGDSAVVFESAKTLQQLAESPVPFIPIVHTDETEYELANIYRQHHCIVVRHRNAVDSNPDIALDLPNHDTLKKALAAMGIKDDRVEKLAKESGCSPTILRRRLSQISAIRKPRWSNNAELARSLIPITLVGAWHEKSKADCEIVATLADKPYQKIEESITSLLLPVDDCPVWSVEQYRGIASKMDALFAISKQITSKDLTEFLWLAEYVLSESDPALDLPEDARWAAGLYGKVRNHSVVLRKGICETLVILSVHGNNLFKERLGINIEDHVSSLIRKLLTPLSLDKLISQSDDLPNYAEAAPGAFLNLLEEDLRESQPVVLGLLKPTGSSLFDSPIRSELLWALECLAWKHFWRVSLILAQMSGFVIDDNWINKPISSLQAMYRSWMPQTAASLEERMKGLETLTKKFQDIGWQICIEQLNDIGIQAGRYSYRPRWRNDDSDTSRSVAPKEEIEEFRRKALDLALAWPKHNQKTLGDLLQIMPGKPKESQILVLDLIDAWADSETDERDKARLRDQIRRLAFTRHGCLRNLKATIKDRVRMVYKKLQPRDPVIEHARLFTQHWTDLFDDESEDENLNDDKLNERIYEIRAEAMKRIWAERGFEGVKELLSCSDEPGTVGYALGMSMTGANARTDFLCQCLPITGDLRWKIDRCMQGFLAFLMSEGNEEYEAILSAVTERIDVDLTVRLFRCAPFGQNTWRLLDRYGEETRDRYWREVIPKLNLRHSEEELTEIIDRLLEAERPRTAFDAVHLCWRKIETSRLKRLLFAVATVSVESEDLYGNDAYYISEALNVLDGRGVNPDEMAQLEFMFLTALDRSKHGIPNLERQIAKSPISFVQALAFAFKRNDDGQDPSEWRIDDPDRREKLATMAYRLLGRIRRIPGTEQDDRINAEALLAWLTEVRRHCRECSRVEIGDQKIGELLSNAHSEEDGSWPCLPVCEAMEKIDSQQIGRGFAMGAFNRRGVHVRSMDEGGEQERALAAQYRGWAKLRAFDYPYVSRILENIAADYDREAERDDTIVKIENRLKY